MKHHWALAALLLALLLAIPVLPASAQSGGTGVYLEPYILQEGQTVEGDLTVIGLDGPVILQHGSRVTGNATLVGGTVEIRGEVAGNLAVLATEQITLTASAQIGGNVQFCGSATRADSAAINGSYQSDCEGIDQLLGSAAAVAFNPSEWQGDFRPEMLPDLLRVALTNPGVTPVEQIGYNFQWALLMGGFASLCTLVIPYRMRRISRTALTVPGAAVGLGFLSMLMFFGVSVLLLIALVLLFWLILPLLIIPLLAILWGLAFLLLGLGWSALSFAAGNRLMQMVNLRYVSPMASAAVGGTALTFIVSLVNVTPAAVLWLAIFTLLLSWGLGAVLITRLGSFVYQQKAKIG